MPRFLLAFLALGLASRLPAADVDFNRDVRPILSNNCFACHGPDDKERKAKLRLDTAQGAGAVLGADGELLKRVSSHDPDEVMPPPKTGKKLTAKEIATLTAWVKQGGRYATH